MEYSIFSCSNPILPAHPPISTALLVTLPLLPLYVSPCPSPFLCLTLDPCLQLGLSLHTSFVAFQSLTTCLPCVVALPYTHATFSTLSFHSPCFLCYSFDPPSLNLSSPQSCFPLLILFSSLPCFLHLSLPLSPKLYLPTSLSSHLFPFLHPSSSPPFPSLLRIPNDHLPLVHQTHQADHLRSKDLPRLMQFLHTVSTLQVLQMLLNLKHKQRDHYHKFPMVRGCKIAAYVPHLQAWPNQYSPTHMH